MACLRTKKPEVVKGLFRQMWVLRYGLPDAILSDNGGEFVLLHEWARESGSKSELTAPMSPWSDGRNERSHRTMKDSLRCALIDLSKYTIQVMIPLMETHIPRCMNQSPSTVLPDKASPAKLLGAP